MSKYSPKAQRKIAQVMKEYSRGELHTSSGKKVTDRKQAVAIGISEARRRGHKTPAERD